ncbi:MAG: hypothetical protein P8H19_03550 [Polaribacter sp.]|jgi:hypothetical protein|nr:hypothetical protein [Polaribacter sp.]MDG2357069.1 hypothetical protein [Polaribacter sp.]
MSTKKLVLLCTILVTSCNISYLDNEVDVKWSGDVNMPIGQINYTLTDLFQELDINDINEDTAGNLSFNYIESISGSENTSYDVVIEDLSTFIEVETPLTSAIFAEAGLISPHTIVASEIAPGIPNPLIRKEQINTQVVQIFDLSKNLTAASFIDGQLILNFVSTLSSDVNVRIEIPSLTSKSENTTYQTSQIIGKDGLQLTIPLENYHIDFTHNGINFEQATNNFVINFIVEYDFKLGDTVSDTDKVSLSANLTDAKTEVIYGDFEQESFSFSSQSFPIDFFNNFGQGNVRFANPEMKIKATNGFGFPIGIDLSTIKAKNKTSSLNLRYDGDQNQENTIIIDGIETYSSTATPVITEIIIDKTNSNFSDLLSLKPSEIIIDVIGNANPINTFPNLNFFASINSGFQAELEIEIPLEVNFENIELTRTVEFNNNEDMENFVDFILVLNTENSIPLSGNLEVIFLNNGVDLNVSKSFIAFDAAEINSNGKSIGYKTTSTEVIFSEKDLEKIKTATTIDLKYTLNSPVSKDKVKLLGINDIVVSIAAKTSINL